jgi:hypothetical protein
MNNQLFVMRIFLIISLLCSCSFIALAQQPEANDDFPVYQPNLDLPDILENALPYYYADPLNNYTYCAADGNCERETYQYAFGEGTSPDDSRSNFDIFYSNHWDETLAPEGKPVVLLLPGGNGSRKSERLALRAISYAQRGYVAIVGDYRSARDEMFSDCLDQRQGFFAIQTAIVDARAILRRAFYLSQLPETSFKTDPTKIFLDGVTWGSLTSYHMSIMDADEFPAGTVEILGQEYTFATDLDHLQICEDPDGLCNTYLPFEGYEIRDYIQGVAARSIYVLDPELIDPEDTVPVILVHGTCDVFSPIWMREFRFSSFAHHVSNNGNPLNAPCQDTQDYGYTLFGGERMYQRYLELSGSNTPDVFMRYFRICGEDHTLNDYDIYRTCFSVNCIEINMIEYETFRFFAEILNNISAPNEVFHLDHTLLASPDEVASFQCTVLPGPEAPQDHPAGEYWPGIEEICPNCGVAETEYNNLIRFPYFSAQSADANRYPLIEECATLSDGINQLSSDRHVKVKVYDLMGYLVMERAVSGTDVLRSFLQSGHGLDNGLYALHFSSGLRKVVLIYTP